MTFALLISAVVVMAVVLSDALNRANSDRARIGELERALRDSKKKDESQHFYYVAPDPPDLRRFKLWRGRLYELGRTHSAFSVGEAPYFENVEQAESWLKAKGIKASVTAPKGHDQPSLVESATRRIASIAKLPWLH